MTAYNQYAMDALNHHAAYYLMKPINIDESIKAVDYVRAIKEKKMHWKAKYSKPDMWVQKENNPAPTGWFPSVGCIEHLFLQSR